MKMFGQLVKPQISTLIPTLLGLSLLVSGCRKEENLGPVLPQVDVSSGGPSASDFSSAEQLKAKYYSVIKPNYDHGTSKAFSGVDGKRINYQIVHSIAPEKGSVMLLPGRTEPNEKWAEVIWDLNKQGYTVFVMSHRGQGESERLLSDLEKGYVRMFADYVTDAQSFISQVFNPQAHGKKFLLAHSMGGAVGAFLTHKNAHDFNAFVLSSPMLEIDTGAIPAAAAWYLENYEYALGAGQNYALGKGPFNENADFHNFTDNDVTHSQPRWDIKMEMFQNKSLRLGGATNQWIAESFNATKEIYGFAGRVSAPILMFQAGADDIVKADGQNHFCSASRNCEKVSFPGSYHEILMETDDIRNEALAKMVRYFNSF